MIMVEGWVRLTPGDMERFDDAAESMIQASRGEPGCLHYAYARDLLDPDVLNISEHWRDEAALAEHFAQPHTKAFNQLLSSLDLSDAQVRIYRTETIRTLFGG